MGGERDACFGPGEAEDIAAAESFATKLGIGYRVFDCSEEYEKIVLDYFRRERTAGRTPNPCIVCNRCLKFDRLLSLALQVPGVGSIRAVVQSALSSSVRHAD